MAKPEELKQGVEVWVKNPAHIYAEVIGPRRGDAGLPPEQVTYKLRILPTIQYLHPESLELAQPPKDPKARPEYMSREWAQELGRCTELLDRALAAPGDRDLAEKVADSLAKLGFMIERP